MLAALVVTGAALRALDPHGRVEAWLQRPVVPSSQIAGRFDVAVPNSVVGAVLVLGFVAFSIVGCFAFYPPPSEVFEEMRIAKGEALGAALSGEREHAEQWLAVCDDWTRKLQVGVYLRSGHLSEYHRMKSRVLRDKLDLLEHELAERDTEEIRKVTSQINQELSAYCGRAYLRGILAEFYKGHDDSRTQVLQRPHFTAQRDERSNTPWRPCFRGQKAWTRKPPQFIWTVVTFNLVIRPHESNVANSFWFPPRPMVA